MAPRNKGVSVPLQDLAVILGATSNHSFPTQSSGVVDPDASDGPWFRDDKGKGGFGDKFGDGGRGRTSSANEEVEQVANWRDMQREPVRPNTDIRRSGGAWDQSGSTNQAVAGRGAAEPEFTRDQMQPRGDTQRVSGNSSAVSGGIRGGSRYGNDADEPDDSFFQQRMKGPSVTPTGGTTNTANETKFTRDRVSASGVKLYRPPQVAINTRAAGLAFDTDASGRTGVVSTNVTSTSDVSRSYSIKANIDGASSTLPPNNRNTVYISSRAAVPTAPAAAAATSSTTTTTTTTTTTMSSTTSPPGDGIHGANAASQSQSEKLSGATSPPVLPEENNVEGVASGGRTEAGSSENAIAGTKDGKKQDIDESSTNINVEASDVSGAISTDPTDGVKVVPSPNGIATGDTTTVSIAAQGSANVSTVLGASGFGPTSSASSSNSTVTQSTTVASRTIHLSRSSAFGEAKAVSSSVPVPTPKPTAAKGGLYIPPGRLAAERERQNASAVSSVAARTPVHDASSDMLLAKSKLSATGKDASSETVAATPVPPPLPPPKVIKVAGVAGVAKLLERDSENEGEGDATGVRSSFRKVRQQEKRRQLHMQGKKSTGTACLEFNSISARLYLDAEKLKLIDESVLSGLSNGDDGSGILARVQSILEPVDTASLLPSFVVTKRAVFRAYEKLSSHAEKSGEVGTSLTGANSVTDEECMDLVKGVFRIVKPTLDFLLTASEFKLHRMKLLLFIQRTMHALECPVISPGMSLAETLWDALLFEEIIDENTFSEWENATDDNTPGRTTTLIQTLGWYEWFHRTGDERIGVSGAAEDEEDDDEVDDTVTY